MSDHDATIEVREPDYKDIGKLLVWSWADGRRTVTPTEHDEIERLIAAAEARFDTDGLESHDVVAHVWMTDDETVDEVDWADE